MILGKNDNFLMICYGLQIAKFWPENILSQKADPEKLGGGEGLLYLKSYPQENS